jgi:hypothetical protein
MVVAEALVSTGGAAPLLGDVMCVDVAVAAGGGWRGLELVGLSGFGGREKSAEFGVVERRMRRGRRKVGGRARACRWFSMAVRRMARLNMLVVEGWEAY